MALLGGTISFGVTFLDSNGSAADPGVITFFLRENIDGTELQWTYNAVPVAGTHYPVGMNPITRTGAGIYALAFVARKPERHSGMWQGTGTVPSQSKAETAFVRHSDIVALEP